MILNRVFVFSTLLLWVLISDQANPVESVHNDAEYLIEGIVEKISSDFMILDHEGERVEFYFSSKGRYFYRQAQTGDRVAVWYKLVPNKITVQKGILKHPSNPLNPKRKIILDDRVFFDAQSEFDSIGNFNVRS